MRNSQGLQQKCSVSKWWETKNIDWSGRRDLNSGPPAPKPAGLSLGSPSFSIYSLKTNELEKYLVVAPCTKMWLRMHGVPPIFPSAKKQRNTFTGCQPLNNSNPSVESRKGAGLFGSNVDCWLWRCHNNLTKMRVARTEI